MELTPIKRFWSSSLSQMSKQVRYLRDYISSRQRKIISPRKTGLRKKVVFYSGQWTNTAKVRM
jgi:ribosomal protein S18